MLFPRCALAGGIAFWKFMSQSVTQAAIVNNPKGLHLRPAGLLAQIAAQYQSELTLTKDGITIDARSILDMLTLVATQGSEITVVGVGEDAQQAVTSIVEFIENDTSEDEEG